jgi:FHA domain/Zinc-ribbon containing domain
MQFATDPVRNWTLLTTSVYDRRVTGIQRRGVAVLSAGGAKSFESEGEFHRSGDEVGSLRGPGSLRCTDCGYALSLAALEELPADERMPTCPVCGGTEFRRTPIFEPESDQPTLDLAPLVEEAEVAPSWIAEARARTTEPGAYLAYLGVDTAPTLFHLPEGWTRIGRSATADLRLDDPTVSRRHALVVRTEEGDLRALDDRSLNGLFVNGKRVEWTPLSDGDELEIGRYRLYVVEA